MMTSRSRCKPRGSTSRAERRSNFRRSSPAKPRSGTTWSRRQGCASNPTTNRKPDMAKLRAVECREFIKAAIEKADEMGVPVSIAVVGPEGNLIALERMDDAGFVTPETAWAKAYTVAA